MGIKIVEDPFVTRWTVVTALRVHAPQPDTAFRNLKRRGLASSGWWVPLPRAVHHGGNQRLYLYSALSADAARCVWLDDADTARRLVELAEEVERSAETQAVREVLIALVQALPADPERAEPHDLLGQSLRDYLDRRQRATGYLADKRFLVTAWLSRATTWALVADNEELKVPLTKLARLTAEARRDSYRGPGQCSITFLGVVRRMNTLWAELESESGERWAVARRELEREGLAAVGQPVAVAREELQHGSTVWAYSSAARIGRDSRWDGHDFDPFDTSLNEVPVYRVDLNDVPYVDALLRHEPSVLPASPIPIRGAA